MSDTESMNDIGHFLVFATIGAMSVGVAVWDFTHNRAAASVGLAVLMVLMSLWVIFND